MFNDFAVLACSRANIRHRSSRACHLSDGPRPQYIGARIAFLLRARPAVEPHHPQYAVGHAKHKNIAKHQPSLINIELPCSFADVEMSDITTAVSMSTDAPEILPLSPILRNRARGNRVRHARVGRHAIELHPRGLLTLVSPTNRHRKSSLIYHCSMA